MNRTMLAIFLNLVVGPASVFLLTQFALSLPHEFRMQALFLVMFSMCYYFEITVNYVESLRQQEINTFILSTKESSFTIVNYFAKLIHEGQTKKQIHKDLNNLSNVIDDIYTRAWRLNHPHFLDKNYYVKQRALKLGSFITYTVLSILVCWWVLTRPHYIYMLLPVGAIFALYELRQKIWMSEGTYKKPCYFPFYQTLQSRTKGEGFRITLLRYLINSLCLQHALPLIKRDDLNLIYSNNDLASVDPTDNQTDLVISKHDVNLHELPDDPREPHLYKQYDSFDHFFKEFVTERIVAHHLSEVLYYPEYLSVYQAYLRAKELPLAAQTLLFSAHIENKCKLMRCHHVFYEKSVEYFMSSPRYLLLKHFYKHTPFAAHQFSKDMN